MSHTECDILYVKMILYLLTSNQLICMQPSDSQRQIADRVRNQVRNTGNREMSSPSFGAAEAPA